MILLPLATKRIPLLVNPKPPTSVMILPAPGVVRPTLLRMNNLPAPIPLSKVDPMVR